MDTKAIILNQEELERLILKSYTNYNKSPKPRKTAGYIETRLEALNELWKTFTDNHNKLTSVPKQERDLPYFTEKTFDNTEEVFIEYKSKLKEDLTTLSYPSHSKQITGNASTEETKLPQINLPTFSGSYTEWQTFHDLFASIIHRNPKLSPVQKLHYLKGCLQGDAEEVVNNFSITDANYEEAWLELNRLYKNKRFNANEVLKKLFGQKVVPAGSPNGIKQLINTTCKCLKGFASLEIDTSTWDVIIIHIVTAKLDNDTRCQWETSLSKHGTNELPTFQELKNFLESRYKTMEILSGTTTSKPVNTTKPKVFHSTTTTQKSISCAKCSGEHYIHHCKEFIKFTPKERSDFIQNKKLCFNCFMPNHAVMKCNHPTNCRKCGRRHHTLLHINRENYEATKEIRDVSQPETKPQETSIVSTFSRNFSPCDVLLATAEVKATAVNGVTYVIRALVDQGSQASFVSENTVQILGLKRKPVDGWVSGVGDGQTRVKHVVSLYIQSRHHPNITISINAYVLKSLTSMLPSKVVHAPNWYELQNLPLADPNFTTPGKIDVLLGAEVFSDIILSGVMKNPSRNLIAQNTVLGWIVSGKLSRNTTYASRVISMHTQIMSTDDLLKKFWELEKEPDIYTKQLTKEEMQCETIFQNTTQRREDGRFIVRLPFNSEDPDCQYGQSLQIAKGRFTSLERKLSKNPNLYKEYAKVLDEYIQLDHMRPVPEEDIDNLRAVYLPHHAVVREDKDTTKIRVVFDASCKGVNNVSLNDNLLVGPKLQQDLHHLLLRWRTHRICITADLVKMYRQVVVNDKDIDFQRILWRPNVNEPIKHYQLLRLTFGTASAPYLAVKTIQSLADSENKNYPKAAEITKNDLYMDDLMTGCETETEGMSIFEELNKLMESAGFEFQKWSSNCDSLMEHMGNEKTLEGGAMVLRNDRTVKILGITWNRQEDSFEYQIKLTPLDLPVTKRKVVSDIARLFDPLGWVAPAITTAKSFIQKLWLSGIEWDQELPEPLLHDWVTYRQKLTKLSEFSIPRWIGISTCNECFELQGFCDASSIAYAAVIYTRVMDHRGNVHVNLLTAKTKVAPVKQVSIPRLELCGAVLLAKLLRDVSQVLGVKNENIRAWTDSSVVLAWLSSHPSKWKTFIANRTSEILTIMDNSQWAHVRSGDNPADCASRGIDPQDLVDLEIWKSGPKWLKERVIDYSKGDFKKTSLEEKEQDTVCLKITLEEENSEEIVDRFSSLTRMLRVVSYCYRFLIPKVKYQSIAQAITVEEMENTTHKLIKITQSIHFREELQSIRSHGRVLKKSLLHTLCPTLDSKGILRVGGRIEKANLPFETKHPIILPDKSNFTRLIVLDAHIRTLHGGPLVMLNYIRSKYFIVRGRSQVKKCFRNCVTCRRYSSANKTQLMGQIPEVRITPSKTFKSSGVDYAGPINIRFSPGRGSKAYKGYICLFICMVTRAIHLEAVSDLTYSDNGTNFVGANRQLSEMLRSAQSEWPNEIVNLLTLESTTWHFIPPQAPNFGGLWEAGVRSVKTHLRKAIGDNTLTFEELTTVLTQIEACLNSRPLSVLSNDPGDPLPLTPGHFLVGEPLINICDRSYDDDSIVGLDRWILCQKMVCGFWKKWSKDYLLNLNQRYKWNDKLKEPNVNEVVILREDNVPPAKWVLGKIVEKHPGLDNLTRVVSIKTKNGILKRPTSKISVLV
jgi:hypothetical protein